MLRRPSYIGTGNDGFTCEYCGREVPPATNGSYRNHCPWCLYCKHVDEAPGDRRAQCRGLMEPVALVRHDRKGYQIVHRCTVCGVTRRNRVIDSGVAPDDLEQLCLLSANPLASR